MTSWLAVPHPAMRRRRRVSGRCSIAHSSPVESVRDELRAPPATGIDAVELYGVASVASARRPPEGLVIEIRDAAFRMGRWLDNAR